MLAGILGRRKGSQGSSAMKTGDNKLYYMKDYHREFIKILEGIKPSKHSYETFSDWLVIASDSLYAWKKDAAVEEEYAEIANGYTPQELDKHGQLLGITVNALEDVMKAVTGYDFLGEVFMAADLGNSRNGQFFTPYHISFMMAKMLYGNTESFNRRVGKICDPCCGAGGMLIASAMALKELNGSNYQKDFLYVGQDIDARCARMAFIQTSLMGLPAVITCGNSLTDDVYWQRETIGYHLSGIDYRLRIEAFLEKLKKLENATPLLETAGTKFALPESSDYKSAEAMVINLPPAREYVQGELF